MSRGRSFWEGDGYAAVERLGKKDCFGTRRRRKKSKGTWAARKVDRDSSFPSGGHGRDTYISGKKTTGGGEKKRKIEKHFPQENMWDKKPRAVRKKTLGNRGRLRGYK